MEIFGAQDCCVYLQCLGCTIVLYCDLLVAESQLALGICSCIGVVVLLGPSEGVPLSFQGESKGLVVLLVFLVAKPSCKHSNDIASLLKFKEEDKGEALISEIIPKIMTKGIIPVSQ